MSEEIKEMTKEERIEKLKKSNAEIEGIFENLESGANDEGVGAQVIFSALMLPEKEFSYISELILNEMEKNLNNIDDKLMLVQGLNASGLKAEDLTAEFDNIVTEIEKTMSGELSEQKIDWLKRILAIYTNAINDTQGIAKRIISVPLELCHEKAKAPKYAKAGDAGMDIYAIEDIVINPGETKIVRTGLKCALPLGYEFEVRPRSGLSLKSPLRVANAPGTIDSGYRDEIGVIITNTEPQIKSIEFDPESGKVISFEYGQSYTITEGMRFAQLVLKEVPTCSFYEVSNVKDIGVDRASGFGGTGLE